MTTLITYSHGVTQRFFDRNKAEEIVNQQRQHGYQVTEDEHGNFHVHDDADIDRAHLHSPIV